MGGILDVDAINVRLHRCQFAKKVGDVVVGLHGVAGMAGGPGLAGALAHYGVAR